MSEPRPFKCEPLEKTLFVDDQGRRIERLRPVRLENPDQPDHNRKVGFMGFACVTVMGHEIDTEFPLPGETFEEAARAFDAEKEASRQLNLEIVAAAHAKGLPVWHTAKQRCAIKPSADFKEHAARVMETIVKEQPHE